MEVDGKRLEIWCKICGDTGKIWDHFLRGQGDFGKTTKNSRLFSNNMLKSVFC